MVRAALSNICLRAIERRAHRPVLSRMQEPAVVISPHYDDETLGVGGTIIQKRKSGADVYLVFMTDGSRSHASAMDGRRLSALRQAEALDAAHALGVAADHVRFLNFPETRLAQHAELAVDRVAKLLSEFQCHQVFVPSTLEPAIWSADHNATTQIAFRAVRRAGLQPEILEYLVWFWYHWPWVPVRWGADARRVLGLTYRYWSRWSLWRDLNTAVNITEVQAQKRIALEKYASQMTRLSPDKPWPVLADVGDGEFLNRFFHSREFFKRYEYRAGPTG